MTLYKYRFKITHAGKNMQQVSSFLDKCDLTIGEFAIEETFEFTTKSTHITVKEYKEYLKYSLESCGHKVYKIEGGKIE